MKLITDREFLRLVEQSKDVCFLQDDWRYLKQEFPNKCNFPIQSFIREINIDSIDDIERDGYVGCFYLKKENIIFNDLSSLILMPSISFYFSTTCPNKLVNHLENNIMRTFFNYPETSYSLLKYLSSINRSLYNWIVYVDDDNFDCPYILLDSETPFDNYVMLDRLNAIR